MCFINSAVIKPNRFASRSPVSAWQRYVFNMSSEEYNEQSDAKRESGVFERWIDTRAKRQWRKKEMEGVEGGGVGGGGVERDETRRRKKVTGGGSHQNANV